ncbi:C40 family peptidase [Paenibacillus puerhi]|uniref:C40 family peptidase n=1 Tax=Paenibacillus puerhi TaxID=2692622 RepID=UPI00135B9718|nr:SH3 domain-containing C40 family peptidase [Paenibacillus puerhi]
MKKQLMITVVTTAIALGSLGSFAGQADAATGTIVGSVNFRSQPSTGSSTYGYLKSGERVDIISKVNNWWYKVKDDQGRVGYVSTNSKYIKVNGSTSGSGSSSSGSSGSSASDSSSVRNKVIAAGKTYLGTPYEYASNRNSTRTFDCSAFVRQAFKVGAGITLPSDSRSQGDYVKAIGKTSTNWKNLKAGDLMFFMEYRGTKASAYPSNNSNQRITHVGIYLGDGKILHTYSKESGGVRIDTISGKHWEHRFIFGGSALK